LPNRKAQNQRSHEGYTLIEVLVALVIFSAMMILAGVALNQGLLQYHGLVDRGLNFWDHAKQIWLDKSFHSVADYYVFTKKDRWFPYFKGDFDSITYVTLAPFVGELPVVVWIKKEPDTHNKIQLRYYEMPVLAKTGEELEKENVFATYRNSPSYKVLSDLDQVDFTFYSCETQPPQRCGWNSTFDGSKAKILPSAVKIAYRRDNEKGFMLFEINVNSLIKESYDEVYLQQ
jgi:general secretion pathway protein J